MCPPPPQVITTAARAAAGPICINSLATVLPLNGAATPAALHNAPASPTSSCPNWPNWPNEPGPPEPGQPWGHTDPCPRRASPTPGGWINAAPPLQEGHTWGGFVRLRLPRLCHQPCHVPGTVPASAWPPWHRHVPAPWGGQRRCPPRRAGEAQRDPGDGRCRRSRKLWAPWEKPAASPT